MTSTIAIDLHSPGNLENADAYLHFLLSWVVRFCLHDLSYKLPFSPHAQQAHYYYSAGGGYIGPLAGGVLRK